jgi:hypothetical protein
MKQHGLPKLATVSTAMSSTDTQKVKKVPKKNVDGYSEQKKKKLFLNML